jgi:hypothetical protein
MHFLMVLIVIVIGGFGVISFLKDSSGLVESLKESAGIGKKIKEEESAFMQFCEGQKVRDESKKISPAKAQTAPASSSSAPLSVPFLSQKKISFDSNPFGNVDFRHLGNPTPLSAAPASQAAAPAAANNNNNTDSQAQQAKSSSNPIIKTWGGYVSQIEDASK